MESCPLSGIRMSTLVLVLMLVLVVPLLLPYHGDSSLAALYRFTYERKGA